MDMRRYKVKDLIKGIKKRWKIRALKQGLAMTVLTFLFFAIIYSLFNYKLDVNPLVVAGILAVGAITILTVFIKFLVLPLTKSLSDEQLALFIEEKIPGMEDRINSAIELENKNFSGNNEFFDKLIDDARSRAKTIQLSTVVDRKKERILSYSSNALLVLGALLFYAFMDDIKDIAADLKIAVNPLEELKQDFVDILPGNVEIEKGESQLVLAELKHGTDKDAVLHYKIGEGEWVKETMQKGIDNKKFQFHFPNIQQPVKYFLELDQTKSFEYNISIYEFPKVENIDLTYKYPSYTGIPSRKEENTGDIRGLAGSTVSLNIKTNGTAESGELVFEDGKTISLVPSNEGYFTANVKLTDPNSYHVKLTDIKSKNNKFPEEYLVTPIEDEKPIITIIDPERDLRVNPVEEILMTVSVSDDFSTLR